jgi:folate-dependent phosphoribosylglycinamide formyltransferase PurN
MDPMKIVVLLPKLHAGAELALNRLLKQKELEIVGIVRSDISPLNKHFWKYFRYGIRRMGVFYAAMIGILFYLPGIGLALAGLFWWGRRRRWLTVDQLIKKHELKLHDTENINNKKTVKALKSWKPDLVVSLYFDQILKKPVIQVAKVATLNMHPGLLPRYKGLWPNFWKLHNKEKYAGVTIHHINEKIDAGDVIAQVKFPIKKHDTRFSLGLKSASKGTELLIKTLIKIKKGVHLPPLKLKGKPRYYGLPKKKHFDAFFARGKKLVSFLGFWREMDRRM